MREIGVFARVFPAGNALGVSRQISSAGFTMTQLNLSTLGRATLDATLLDDDATAIRRGFATNSVSIWGVSGTFNTIDPDVARRQANIEACIRLLLVAPSLGARAVTLCTGTRTLDNMWKFHPDNSSREAWVDLRTTLDYLLPHAARAGILLGIEPEPGNVVANAPLARKLLDELGEEARHITIVMDPANLLSLESLPRQHEIIDQGFELLADWIGCVHAKDVVADGAYSAPGRGAMDYPYVMHQVRNLPERVPVIAQDLDAGDAPRVSELLRRLLDKTSH